MAAQEIKRNLEQAGIYISRWQLGLNDQRSPLFTPMSAMGLQMISRMDALWTGQNADISHEMTLVRRAGFPRYCSSNLSSTPLLMYGYKDVNGNIKKAVDTTTAVSWFDSGSITALFTKTTTQRGSFLKVGSTLYYCNGTDTFQCSNGVLSKWGIDAPVTAPTIGMLTGALSPKSGYKWVFVYKRSATGHVSSASPVSANSLAQTNKQFTLSGTGSTHADEDQIEIYRTEDGGANYYLLVTIANTAHWTYTDNTADDGLNTDIMAPMAGINDPPPAGISLVCMYLGRVWVAVDNLLYCGAGPDSTNGIPEECFPPANVWKLPGKITAFAPTTNGLVVFLEDDAYVVLGSDLASFKPKIWQRNFGVKSQCCVAQDGDLLYIYTSKKQLFELSDSLSEVGFPIQRRLGAFDPTNVSLALYRSGADEGLFISNGVDIIYRYSVAMGSWSTPYTPVGGAGILASIEVATSDYRLLMGRADGAILTRDTAQFNDDGATYPAWAVVGSIIVAPPRQVAVVNSVLLETMPVGTYPTVSVLMNEVSGNFVTLPNPVPDPPQLPPSKSVKMMRHDLLANQAAMPLYARHLQVKIAWPAEDARNELLTLGIV
jgi:hypothetical protein